MLNYKKITPQKRLLNLLKLDKKDIVILFAYSLFIGILMLAVPIASQTLINMIAFGTFTQPIFVLSSVVFIFLGFAETLKAIQTYTVEILQRRIFLRISMGIAKSMTESKFNIFDKIRGHELANRFFEIMNVQKTASMMFLEGLSVILQIIIGLVLLAIYHPFLLAFDIFLIIGILFIFFFLGRGGSKTSIKESSTKYKIAEWLEEIGKHPMLFQSQNGKNFAMTVTDNLAKSYLDKREKHFKILFRQYVGTFALHAIASSLLLGLGGWLVVKGQLSVGQLVAAELVVNAIVDSLIKFGKYFESYFDVIASMDKLGDILDLPQDQLNDQTEFDAKDGIEVEIKNLSLRKNQNIIFDEINFHIPKNKTILISGNQGSGKTVFSQILCGLRPPPHGQIKFNKIDYTNLNHDSFLNHTTLIRYDELLPCTIYENIVLSDKNFSYSDVQKILEHVDAWEDIAKLENKLDFLVYDSTYQLPDSIVAKILIARSIIRKPRLIVIDQLFDHFSEHTQESLTNCLKNLNWPHSTIIFTTSEQKLGNHKINFKFENKKIQKVSES